MTEKFPARLVAPALLMAGCVAPSPEGASPEPTSQAVASPGWSAEAQAGIAAGEYAPRRVGGELRATNRAQGLRAVVRASGLVVTDRSGSAEVELGLRAWGREEHVVPVGGALPEEGPCLVGGATDALGGCLRRMDLPHDGLVEWWENRPDGLEHGFTVTAPPDGDGPLVFELSVSGATIALDADAATLRRPGADPLRYAGLVAWDARGRTLPAWMEESDAGLRLLVDDEGAIGTITVDPLLTTAAWTAEPDQAGASFGWAVASAGDVNGDGYGDVVIGAPGYDGGETDEGRAFLYLGTASGLATTAAWTAESDQLRAAFAKSVASAGDVNGDGYGDLIVGDPEYNGTARDGGMALVYLGSASGLAATAAWSVMSSQTSSGMGTSVASAGDVNGDGYGDVIVSAPAYSAGESYEGRAFVYLGSSSGLATTATWTAEGDQAEANFGASVASAGDVNGDGYGDVLVGATGWDNGSTSEGEVVLYLGSSSGLASSAAWTVEGEQDGAQLGGEVAAAGDVDGDGYGDVILGAEYYDGGEADEGGAWVYLGSSSGLGASAAWTVESDEASAHLGASVSSAGDVNGDGYADVVVGAYDAGPSNRGEAQVYYGSSSGLATSASWSTDGDQDDASFGYSVASAGDVNGDGFGDLVVGAVGYDGGEGRAFLYFGNGADGTTPLSLGAQARQEGVATPIAAGLASTRTDAFDVAMATARGPWGRGKASLQVEVEALGVPFDGTGLELLTVATDTGLTGVALQGTIEGLLPLTGYHWRARLLASAAEGRPQGWGRWVYGGRSGDPVGGHVYTSGTLYPDSDGDEYGDGAAATLTRGASSAGYVANGLDCDDADAAVHPGALELCDGLDVDEDCSGFADDADAGAIGQSTFYMDEDGDGYGSSVTASFCDLLPGYASTSDDCDDTAMAINPGAIEACDSADADEDCDGLVDDADPSATGQSMFYADSDGDAYGGATTGSFCDLPVGYVETSTDCDDAAASTNPGASEVCDVADADEDCDGLVDDADASATGQSMFYADSDGDGYGGATTGSYCDLPAGYLETSTDCDDALASTNPGGAEVCDAANADEDCDGAADDADASATGKSTFYVDADGDGYGSTTTASACDAAGYATNDTDCDDGSASYHPGASEEDCADPNDYNCDGSVGYVDEDGDGSPACEDCDDLDAGVFAGGVEVAGDGTDGDCDGTELCYVDADDDDYLADGAATVESADLACDGPGEADNSALAGDCDDENAAFHPGATEDDCEDPNDYNCDGASGRTDADADGFMACEECDDASGAVNPDADEVCNDVDDDCDGTIDVDAVDAGTWYLDADADGYTDPAMSTTACDAPESYSAATDDDCDDADATSYPGADDLPDDGIDQDCDGADATADATPDDTGGVAKDGGCGCDSTGVSGAWALVLGVLAGATRRRTDRSPVRNVTREGRRGSSSACYTPGLWPPGVG